MRKYWKLVGAILVVAVLAGVMVAAMPNAPKPKEVDAINYTELGSDTPTNDIDGNAGTANALAADGMNCAAGSYPLGVNEFGDAQGCTVDADTQYGGNDFALSNQSCAVGQVVTGIDTIGNVACAANVTQSVSIIGGGSDSTST